MRWEYQTTLPASWENLYASQEARVRIGHGITDWFKIEKGIYQGCILSSFLFNFCAAYIMWKARMDESQAWIKIARRNINNLRYADDTTLMAESEEELKSLLMKVKEEREKAVLKLNIQKLRSWHPVPFPSWRIEGEKWKQWQILFSWAPKSQWMVTATMKLKAPAPCKESYDKLRCVLNSRDITLPTKVRIVKAIVLLIVM